MNDQLKARWQKGKGSTLHFYKAKLPWKERQFNRGLALPHYFAPLIGSRREVKIAELGSGMFCTIGSQWPTAKVEIYPSDALADEFNQILKNAGITALIPIVREDMENLTYPDNFFDIVHCVNALDHTTDPIKAIREMHRVAKPSGYIYLRHFFNAGEREKYHGLHFWNIDLDGNNECIIWNPEKKYLLSDYFPGFKSVKKIELDYEKEELIVSVLQKV